MYEVFLVLSYGFTYSNFWINKKKTNKESFFVIFSEAFKNESFTHLSLTIYIYIYMCVCVCVCDREVPVV